jgi:hypothetical protein
MTANDIDHRESRAEKQGEDYTKNTGWMAKGRLECIL